MLLFFIPLPTIEYIGACDLTNFIAFDESYFPGPGLLSYKQSVKFVLADILRFECLLCLDCLGIEYFIDDCLTNESLIL